jgi:hypothetical protein
MDERQRQTNEYMLTDTGLDTMWKRAYDRHVDDATLRADVVRLVAEVRRLRVLLNDGSGEGT